MPGIFGSTSRLISYIGGCLSGDIPSESNVLWNYDKSLSSESTAVYSLLDLSNMDNIDLIKNILSEDNFPNFSELRGELSYHIHMGKMVNLYSGYNIGENMEYLGNPIYVELLSFIKNLYSIINSICINNLVNDHFIKDEVFLFHEHNIHTGFAP